MDYDSITGWPADIEVVQKTDNVRVDYFVEILINGEWTHTGIDDGGGISSHVSSLQTALDYVSKAHTCTKRARIIKRTVIELNEVAWERL